MFCGIDYRDRWGGGLTLRRIGLLIRRLPPDSSIGAVGREGKPWWTLTDHLIDDLRMSLTGNKKKPAKPHPLRPRPSRRRQDMTPQRRARLDDARRRARERRIALGRGET